MRAYRNRGGNSGVASYDSGPDWIALRFADGGTYRYNRHPPGLLHVVQMQRLAAAGRCICIYLNRQVRDDYATRLD